MNKIIYLCFCCVGFAHAEAQFDVNFLNELQGITSELAISEGVSAGSFSVPAETSDQSDFSIRIMRLPIPIYSTELGKGVFRAGVKLGYSNIKKEYYPSSSFLEDVKINIQNSSVALVAAYQYPLTESFFMDSELALGRSKMTIDLESDYQTYKTKMSSQAWLINPSLGIYYKYTKNDLNSLLGVSFRSMQTINTEEVARIADLRSDVVSIKMDLDKEMDLFDIAAHPLAFLYISKYIKGDSVSRYLAELGAGFYWPLGFIAGQQRVLKLSTSVIQGEEGFRGWTLGAALAF
jgi:hypothetical protein